MTRSGYASAWSKAMKAACSIYLSFHVAACGSSFQQPAAMDSGLLRARAITKTEDNIRVAAAVPSVAEAKSAFGIDLGKNGIQPLWLEIENSNDRPFIFLPTGLDPEYFAPLEVAFLYGDGLSQEGRATLANHIRDLSFDSRKLIYPGETVSGFVYLNHFDPTLVAEITLIGRKWSDRIALLVPVPGTDERNRSVEALAQLYAEHEITEIDDEAALRTALEGLPCCATVQDGSGALSPLNVVFIGEIEELGPAFTSRGYRYTPASLLYAFGRQQDLSGNKTSRWVTPQPHTLRFWLTPLRYRGTPIWIGQVSTRLGGRFSGSGEQVGRIEPDVDEARNDLVQDLLYSQSVRKIGFVKGVRPVIAEKLQEAFDRRNVHTDGLRAVMVFGGKDVSLAMIDFFDWERLADHYRQQIE